MEPEIVVGDFWFSDDENVKVIGRECGHIQYVTKLGVPDMRTPEEFRREFMPSVACFRHAASM